MLDCLLFTPGECLACWVHQTEHADTIVFYCAGGDTVEIELRVGGMMVSGTGSRPAESVCLQVPLRAPPKPAAFSSPTTE